VDDTIQTPANAAAFGVKVPLLFAAEGEVPIRALDAKVKLTDEEPLRLTAILLDDPENNWPPRIH
jgi:hypothetical protein